MPHDRRAERPTEGPNGPGARTSDLGRPKAPLRVLLVTASSDVKQQVLVMLRRLEHVRPLGATRDIGDARRWIEALQPDAVLLHVARLDGDVLSLLPTIRDLPSPPAVVVLSEESNDTLRWGCLAHGAQAFLDIARPEFDGLPLVLAAL